MHSFKFLSSMFHSHNDINKGTVAGNWLQIQIHVMIEAHCFDVVRDICILYVWKPTCSKKSHYFQVLFKRPMTFAFMNNSLGETLSHNLFYHIYLVADGISEVPVFDLQIYFFSWLLYKANWMIFILQIFKKSFLL